MNDQYTSHAAVIAVSCPGGMSKQFRVQVQSSETSSSWKLVGSFRNRQEAGQCAATYEKAGQKTRVVCNTLPTAA
jgi:hypothetical protein